MKIKYKDPIFLIIIISAILFDSCQPDKLRVKIEEGPDAAQVRHGIHKIMELSDAGKILVNDNNPDILIRSQIDSARLKPEAYQIEPDNDIVQVTGGDATGVMYGLLEIKEQLENGNTAIEAKEGSPHLSFRAVKFNLPWDSYRRGEALQLHMETCRDTLFWQDFLDMMTENRFNVLTLWNLHPFSYMVRLDKYPEALSVSEDELNDWKNFWTTLFSMARERGIDTYLVNWNIFVSSEFAEAFEVAEYSSKGEFNVEQGDTSEIVKDYMRKSVKNVINEYPDLTGLGITLGEGMGGMTAEQREKWLLESYIEGMRVADRRVKFIHRVPLSAGLGSGGSTSVTVEQMTRQTLDTLTCVDGPINIELKFNWSHGHSTPHLAKVHGGELSDTYWNPIPDNYKLAWMIRNEDFFMLRWGQPDFIRKHMARNVHPYVNGYFVGSECYIPAKDYITSLSGSGINYAFERQWMYYKTWGRLLYDPDTPDKVFEKSFLSRFPEYGKELFESQVKVSKVPLVIASYFNATWDFTLYSEGMLTLTDQNKMDIITVNHLRQKEPMDPDYLSVKEFLSGEFKDENKISPLQLADSVDSFCKEALQEVKDADPGDNIDLLYEVADIRAWAYLGMYFSDKLRAAVEQQRYLDTNEDAYQENTITWLEQAVDNWKNLVEVTQAVYEPVPLLHYNHNAETNFHWSELEDRLMEELNSYRSSN